MRQLSACTEKPETAFCEGAQSQNSHRPLNSSADHHSDSGKVYRSTEAEYVAYDLIMVVVGAQGDALLALLCLSLVFNAAAQYENYSFRNFPKEELVPLTAAYGLALDHYAAENWTESIRYLGLSLRLHRLLKDSVRFCVLHCDGRKHEAPSAAASRELRVRWHVMTAASCQKRCRAHFPALQLHPPGARILEDFRTRSPYRYLHSAHSKALYHDISQQCLYIEFKTIFINSFSAKNEF